MYGGQTFDEKLARSGECDVVDTTREQRLLEEWSPREETRRYVSRNRYASPRSLGKSMSRRNGRLVRYKANGSLNFDCGVEGSQVRRRIRRTGSSGDVGASVSPNSTEERKERSLESSGENIRYLSRSAKILRALNINYSPLVENRSKQSLSDGSGPSASVRRIQDQSSTPDKKCPFGKISKTLEFDTSASSNSSSFIRISDSSFESTDENQNQTPSRKAIKSKEESILVPESEFEERNHFFRRQSLASAENSSKIRRRIEKTINYNCSNSSGDAETFYSTPDQIASNSRRRTILGNSVSRDFGSSTPKNLYDEFTDDEEDLAARTPENKIAKLVPESSSAIKKSHKKERFSGRNILEDEDNEDCDNVSESGSLFDYSVQQKSEQSSNQEAKDSEGRQEVNRRSARSLLSEFDNPNESEVNKESKIKEETEEMSETSRKPENLPLIPELLIIQPPENESAMFPGSVDRPGTPENSINSLQSINTVSIKRSHKKIKDTRKKLLLRKDLDEKEDKIEDQNCACAEDRAATPENTNSSRLLLSQFSSVKKSHRKDKHGRKQQSESEFNKKVRIRDSDEPETDPDSEIPIDKKSCSTDNSFSSCATDLSSEFQEIREICEENSDEIRRKMISEGNSDKNSGEIRKKSISKKNCEENRRKTITDQNSESRASISSETCEFSGSKRKNEQNDESLEFFGVEKSFRSNCSASFDYQSAEDEFKIFTPIKKRKSLLSLGDKRKTMKIRENEREKNCNAASRCSTPTTARENDNFQYSRCDFVNREEISAESSPIRSSEETEENICTNDENESNGRSTPQNDSNIDLIVALNSIKKSHKKDKRGNVSRRRFICGQEEKNRDETLEKIENTSPQPSTSYEIVAMTTPQRNNDENNSKTPPNCLKTKSYLRLLQTTSIKRSHKKVRDRKKISSPISVEDRAISDDGSIFEGSDREENPENQEENLENQKENPKNEEKNPENPKENEEKEKINAKNNSFRSFVRKSRRRKIPTDLESS